MPDGRTHVKTTVVLSAVVGISTAILSSDLRSACALSAGVLLGTVVTPDLDVDNGCISHYLIRELFGKVIGYAWWLMWLPYALVVPHRSVFSHGVAIGTLIRLTYITLVNILLHAFGVPMWFDFYFCGLMAFGLFFSDALHIILDAIF